MKNEKKKKKKWIVYPDETIIKRCVPVQKKKLEEKSPRVVYPSLTNVLTDFLFKKERLGPSSVVRML